MPAGIKAAAQASAWRGQARLAARARPPAAGGLGGVSSTAATVYRINATSGNPKAEWEKQGAPDYPSPRQIAAIHAASEVKNPTVKVTCRDGKIGLAGVTVEPYSLVAVRVTLAGDTD